MYGESCRECACDCEVADGNNRKLNEKLKDEITRQLGIDMGHKEA